MFRHYIHRLHRAKKAKNQKRAADDTEDIVSEAELALAEDDVEGSVM